MLRLYIAPSSYFREDKPHARGLIAGNDEFPCQRAKTLEEACKLVEAGFEYITDMDGGKILRKRK